MANHPTSKISKFTRKEDGAVTAFGLFLTVAALCVGGLGLDYANGVLVRTHLQTAADSAAHAALIARDLNEDPNEAKAVAILVAQTTMPPARFGDTINEDDIQFGDWDAATQVFTPDALARNAVQVRTERLASRSNSVGTLFMQFIGINSLDVRSVSVFERYYPNCFREGFVAENRVDVQSNNTYGQGFCIHSNDHVEMNNGNTFMAGTIVSMPNKADLVIPSGGETSNPGLTEALQSGAYRLRILDQMDAIIAGVEDPESPFFRTDYVDIDAITGTPPRVTITSNKNISAAADWTEGAIHTLDCVSPGKQMNFGGSNDVFRRGILITNCIIKFGQNVALEDVVMINTNTSIKSFNSPAKFTLGVDDGCASGGGAQLVTKGGVSFTSQFNAYGAQIIAEKLVTFTSQSDSIEGISILTNDEIDANSLINVGFCGGAGMTNNFLAAYFRLAA